MLSNGFLELRGIRMSTADAVQQSQTYDHRHFAWTRKGRHALIVPSKSARNTSVGFEQRLGKKIFASAVPVRQEKETTGGVVVTSANDSSRPNGPRARS